MKKIACFTLNVEPDYGQDHIRSRHLVDEILLKHPDRLDRLFGPLDIELTAFVVAELVEDTPEIVESLQAVDAEIELHSYSHQMNRDRADDTKRGIRVFEEVLGDIPNGYRAPQGAISETEIDILDAYGVQFDSSVFPFFRFGRYSNFFAPQEPYLIDGTSIVEFPIGSILSVRLPISLSYMMLFGWTFYSKLINLAGLPSIVVFDFHLHDIYSSSAFSRLSRTWQLIYTRIYKQNPLDKINAFVSLLLRNGYSFMYMSDLYKLVLDSNVNL